MQNRKGSFGYEAHLTADDFNKHNILKTPYGKVAIDKI